MSSDKLKGKWVVLFFYPLAWTFVCPTEIYEFDNKLSDFKAAGAEVIGVSARGFLCACSYRNTCVRQQCA
jgi:alkyl hydroperoxide reductase subunit AhpC